MSELDKNAGVLAGARASAAAGQAWAAASIQTGSTWQEATEAVTAALDLPSPPDLALVFVDSRFGSWYEDVIRHLREATGAIHLAGCSGNGVIGPGIEAEGRPSVSVLAFGLPGAVLTPAAIVPDKTAAEELARLPEADAQAWLLFADPFSVNTDNLVNGLQERMPGRPLLGGMASAHNMGNGTAVFLDGEVFRAGAVLVGLGGSVRVRALVAQGAEPIGQSWTVTDCEQNVVKTIGLRPALEVLVETLEELDEGTRRRAQQNLLVGLAMDEYRDRHERGDFLIRNLMGADRESGALVINAIPRVGQTFQFQFRDAAAADEDLRVSLERLREELEPGEVPLGAVLCACNGRGAGLFGAPDHDAKALEEALGPIPAAGLFCNGEIGPVGNRTFLHGFTASIAVLTVEGTPSGGQ